MSLVSGFREGDWRNACFPGIAVAEAVKGAEGAQHRILDDVIGIGGRARESHRARL